MEIRLNASLSQRLMTKIPIFQQFVTAVRSCSGSWHQHKVDWYKMLLGGFVFSGIGNYINCICDCSGDGIRGQIFFATFVKNIETCQQGYHL